MKRTDFRFFEALRVRWAEVDMQQVVFNAHYLMYVDTALAGYWRAAALPYEATLAALSGDLFVRKATLEYHAPARYDDPLAVGIRLDHIGNSTLRFAAGLFRGEQLLVEGELVYVWTDAATRRPCTVPASLRETLAAFEAGEAMVTVEVGDWGKLGRDAQALRTAVFVEEQGVPVEVERDARDAAAVHAVARNRLGLPLGTGRLLAGPARIGRMAVRRDIRGAGVGEQLLAALTAAAVARGDRELSLHAQVSATGFYRRAGFEPHGDPFEEAGIGHQEMRRSL